MRRKITSIVMVLCMVLTLFPTMAFAVADNFGQTTEYGVPTTTAAVFAADASAPTDYEVSGNTITIKTAKGMGWLTQNNDYWAADYTIELANDICVSDFIWLPIGIELYQNENGSTPFLATFDGKAHTISGVYINSRSISQGLFGYNKGTIKNLGIANSNITGGTCTAAIVGKNKGTVMNCWNSGEIRGADSVGGIVGQNEKGFVYNSYNIGRIYGNKYVGGIAGSNNGDASEGAYVYNSYNSGPIRGLNPYNNPSVYIGAVVGDNGNFGTVRYCYYLNDTAKDGKNFAQTGLGYGNAGSANTDISGETNVFTGTGDSCVLSNPLSNNITSRSSEIREVSANAKLFTTLNTWAESETYKTWTNTSNYPELGEFYTSTKHNTLDLLDVGSINGGGQNWDWNGDTKTLTLSGSNLSTASPTGIILPTGASIVLAEGTDNFIESTQTSGNSSHGIYATNGLNISGGGNLTVTGGATYNYSSYGVYSGGDLTISGGRVTASGGMVNGHSHYSYGLNIVGKLTIDSGTVTFSGGSYSYIYAANNSGGSFRIYGRGINGDDLIMNGGILNAHGGTSTNASRGINYSWAVKLLGGTTLITCDVNAPQGIALYGGNGIVLAQGQNILEPEGASVSVNPKPGYNNSWIVENDGTTLAKNATIGPTPLDTVSINGQANVGELLTATVSPGGATVDFQWISGLENIAGATGVSYTVETSDIGKEISVTVRGTGNYSGIITSHSTAAVANADQGAPTGLTGVAPTSVANNDGKITGTSRDMEYKLSSASDWTAVIGNEITGLAAGTYNVRYEAKVGFNAGTAKDVVIPAYIKSEVTTLSNLTVDGTSVMGFAAGTLSYNVELAAGTTNVPSVVGTPPDANATVVVTDAVALAGSTTILVTAEDGTTIKTYTINFTVASAPTGGSGGGSSATPTINTDTGSVTDGQLNNAAGAAKNGETVTIRSNRNNEVTFPASGLGSLAGKDNSLTIVTEKGTLTFDSKAVLAMGTQASAEDIKVIVNNVEKTILTEAQQEKVGDRVVYDLTVMSGGKLISSFNGGKVSVSIPYLIEEGQSTDDLNVWYMADDGSLTEIKCIYDAKTKSVTFLVDHFSKYIIGYVDVATWVNPFRDVISSAWFYEAVAYVNSRNLMKGQTENTFAPQAAMTRGMFVTILGRMEGVDTSMCEESNAFSDVDSSQYYSSYIAWASDKSIVNGVGEDKFAPNAPVTREQMAVMMTNYMKDKGQGPEGLWAIQLKYGDLEDSSSWASEGLMFMTMKGLMKGMGNDADGSPLFAPKLTSNRAQTAQLMMNFQEFLK